MTAMSKLLKMKEWLTIPDAARHLSLLLNEPVSAADLLQFALEKHLKLSVDLVNHAQAKIGKIVPFSEVPMFRMPPIKAKGEGPGDEEFDFPDGFPIEEVEKLTKDTPFLSFKHEIVTIRGLWDLSMMGGEQIDVMHELQREIGGPVVQLVNMNGTFLMRADGTYASLQEQLPGHKFSNSDQVSKKGRDSYYFSVGRLPDDCTLVIRTSELLAFQAKIEVPRNEKPIQTKERNSLLRIIGVLCKEAKIDLDRPSKAASTVQGLAEMIGIDLPKRTVENHLIKVADAMADRKV